VFQEMEVFCLIRYKRSVGIAMSPTRNGRKTRKNLVERLSLITAAILFSFFILPNIFSIQFSLEFFSGKNIGNKYQPPFLNFLA
jgi:hypothetical protein